jgi:hypothetical protein
MMVGNAVDVMVASRAISKPAKLIARMMARMMAQNHIPFLGAGISASTSAGVSAADAAGSAPMFSMSIFTLLPEEEWIRSLCAASPVALWVMSILS